MPDQNYNTGNGLTPVAHHGTPAHTAVVGSEAERIELGEHLDEIKRVLREGKAKIEFGFAFTASGTVQTAQVWESTPVEKRYGGGTTQKWFRTGPFLTTKAGTRSSLLELLAHLARTEEAP